MAKHTKPDRDEDEEFDSNKHREAAKAKIQAENKEIAEDKEIAVSKQLPQHGETREELLARIRKMREEKPVEVETPVFRSEGLQKEFDAEQEAGRAAVAKAAAEMERNRALWQQQEEGEKNKAG
jgi:hypothetical protein